MTRDDDRERVLAECRADRAGRVRLAHRGRDLAVGARAARVDRARDRVDAAVEFGDRAEVECDVLEVVAGTFEQRLDALDDALYIGRLYAIHGTNANFGIGLRVSHGCVRLRNDDIKFLFENVPVGTRVQFINEPVKATSEPDGSRYIEVHNPLSTSEDQINNNEIVPITLKSNVQAVTSQADVETTVVDQAVQNRSGMPVRLN